MERRFRGHPEQIEDEELTQVFGDFLKIAQLTLV